MTTPTIGHNSGESDKGISAQRLKSLIERIERIEVDVSNAQNDRKEIYSEAKSDGFDTKIMKQVVRLRKIDKSDRQESDAILAMYMDAIGEA